MTETKYIPRGVRCSNCGCEFIGSRMQSFDFRHGKRVYHSQECRNAGKVRKKKKTTLERFLGQIDQNGPIPEKCPERGPCWLWRGHKDKDGYSKFTNTVAHRWAYGYYRGPVAEDMDMHHICENRGCCNPWHVEPLPHGEHVKLCHPRVRRGFRTVCNQGHNLTPENTYVSPKGSRCCIICRRRRSSKAYHANPQVQITANRIRRDRLRAAKLLHDSLPTVPGTELIITDQTAPMQVGILRSD